MHLVKLELEVESNSVAEAEARAAAVVVNARGSGIRVRNIHVDPFAFGGGDAEYRVGGPGRREVETLTKEIARLKARVAEVEKATKV